MAWGISTPRPKPDPRLIKSQTPGAGSCARDGCFSFLKSLWVIVKAARIGIYQATLLLYLAITDWAFALSTVSD